MTIEHVLRAMILTAVVAAEMLVAGGAYAVELNSLDFLTSGNHSFTADGQTFQARVDNDGSHGWLLVGRGREGWQFDTDGQGAVDDVNQNLGTSAAFSPALYSDAIINDLISASGTDMTDIEVLLRRA